MADCGVYISSVNLSGLTTEVTFFPQTGGTAVDLGNQVFPFSYVADYYYGTYNCYVPTYAYSYTIVVPAPTPTPTVTSTSTPTVTPTPTSTPTSTPLCPSVLTGSCPTFIGKYSPSNLTVKNESRTDTLIGNFGIGGIVGQIALDNSRLFMVDNFNNYYNYTYQINPIGCYTQTLIDTFTPSGITNASFTLGFYNENTLIIGDGSFDESATGSTLYLYDMISSGTTKWLEIGDNAYVGNVYYNTGNTQMVLGIQTPSTGVGYYQLYSGNTNPQLISEIPVSGFTLPQNAAIYFSGNTAITVGDSAGQYILDFQNGTIRQVINPSTLEPINYIVFDPEDGYINTLASPVNCYTFEIPFIPPTPTPTVTPTNTPSPTPTEQVIIQAILIGPDEYLSVGTNEYLQFN
jgi:hypothetical protein